MGVRCAGVRSLERWSVALKLVDRSGVSLRRAVSNRCKPVATNVQIACRSVATALFERRVNAAS